MTDAGAAWPASVWLHIASYLTDPHDLLSLCATNRRLRRLASSAPLWRAMCDRAWPEWTAAQVDVLDTRTFNWKFAFARQCKLLQRAQRPKHLPRGPRALSDKERCSRCRRPTVACFCASLPAEPIDNSACPVLILQDTKTQVSIGTVQILQLALTHCTVINDRDFGEGVHPELDAVLASGSAYLLFPSISARPVKDCHLERAMQLASVKENGTTPPPPITLIAIDGSWRTAKAIYRWNPRLALHTLPVQITDTEASVFGEIKREPKEHFLSTMEAVAKALGGLLTGDENSILPSLLPALRHIVTLQLEFAKAGNERREERARQAE